MEISTGTAQGNRGPWKLTDEPVTEEQIIEWAKTGLLTYTYIPFKIHGDRITNMDAALKVHARGPYGVEIDPEVLEPLLEDGRLQMASHDLMSGTLFATPEDDEEEENQ